MALEVLGASPALQTDLSYGLAELFLRRHIHGTVFQPDAFTPGYAILEANHWFRKVWNRLPHPPGCGKTEHLRLSSLLQSPFNFVSYVDNDTEFVAIGQAILRPYGSTFRRFQDVQLSMATV